MNTIKKPHSQTKLLIIIPCYNESKNLKDLIPIIKSLTIPHVVVDYIFIDDGSNDETIEILRDANANFLQLAINSGIGTAVQTGYQYASRNGYDIAVQFDGDGQHRAECIKNLIQPIIEDKVDFVIGSRFIQSDQSNFQSSFARRIGIKLLSKLIALFSRVSIKDVTSGFRAANKRVIRLFAADYPSEYPEPVTDLLLARLGYSIKEVPVEMVKRKYGKSSITPVKSVYYMVNVIILLFINLITIRRKK